MEGGEKKKKVNLLRAEDIQVRMENKGKDNSYLPKYSILNWYGNVLEFLQFHSWLQHGECVYLKRTHFPVVLWKTIHKYLCYIIGNPAFQKCATDACSEMHALTC